MIEEGIHKGVYEKSVDNTFKDLKRFQDFLYRNFRNYENYSKMRPKSNQPARMYGTAKTHKFQNIKEITSDNIKFRPIIDQTGSLTYNASQIIASYLKPLCYNEYTIKDTQSFSIQLQELPPLADNEEDVSYDVISLFTNIPVYDTINYILDQIYKHKKLKPICNKLIFKRLLLKLSTDCTFTFNNKFYKQIEGCTMGGPLSVTLSDIHMTRCENDIVIPNSPIYYRRYVDDIFTRRKKNTNDILFENMNNYHENIKLTIELNPTKFLDTKLTLINGHYTTAVYRKSTKLPIHWKSKCPKRYKRNAITGDLYRAQRISTNFKQEISIIRSKYRKANYPIRFINSIITNFMEKNNTQSQENDSFLIPPYFYDEEEAKPNILVELPFCNANETKSKDFIKKFHQFTKNKFKLSIKWITKKVSNLFPLKDKRIHPSCNIYEGVCVCGTKYIGETERNVEIRWKEHNNPNGISEPSKHIKNNINHVFEWKILCNAPKNSRSRKNLEASYISLKRPQLNEQIDFNTLSLFRNGVT